MNTPYQTAEPMTAGEYIRRSRMYNANGEIDLAMADLDKALWLEPNNPDLLMLRFELLDGNLDNPLANLNEALRLNPDNADAFYRRGIIYGNRGDYEKAIADFDRVINLQPDNINAYCRRGTAYRHIGDVDRALKDFNRVLEANPDHVLALRGMGSIHVDNGDIDKAIADLSHAIYCSDGSPLNLTSAYMLRSLAYKKKGDIERSDEDFQRAQWLDPMIRELMAALDDGE